MRSQNSCGLISFAFLSPMIDSSIQDRPNISRDSGSHRSLDSHRIGRAMSAATTLAIAILRSVLALFRSRQDQAVVELALRQQLAVYAIDIRDRISRPWIAPSGSLSSGSGLDGEALSSSFSRRP